MSLVLTEDQLMFRDATKRFAAERAPVAQLRKLRDDNDATGFDREVWREMAQMAGRRARAGRARRGRVRLRRRGTDRRRIGRNLSATPLLSTAVLGVTALLRGGRRHRGKRAARDCRGDIVVALASDEKNRHAPTASRPALLAAAPVQAQRPQAARARRSRRRSADRHCRTSSDVESRDGITLFLIDARANGVVVTRTPTVDITTPLRWSCAMWR